MMTVKYPFALAAVFIWIGFVCAISFLEAWLKFRAPGITVPLGLGIGRLVFNALNKVEWVLAIIMIVNIFMSKGWTFTSTDLIYFVPLVIVMLQSFWLLPALDIRAELHIQGQHVPSSLLHIYFIIAEVVKVAILFILGYSFYH